MACMKKQSIALKNGEHYYYIQQGKGDISVVLLHGNMSSSVHWKPMLERLPETITVYAPDLRGFGDSSYNTPINSLEDFADDVHVFMQEVGISKAIIIGWSTGGGIALEFAAKYPNATQKIVLIESTSHKGYPIFKKDAQGAPIIGEYYQTKDELASDPVQVAPAVAAFESKDATFVSWLWDVAIYTQNKPSAEDNMLYISETIKQRNLVDIDWALATLNMSSEVNFYGEGKANINKVTCPALHIWSEHDIVVPRSMLEENVEALQNTSKVIIFNNSGHSPLVDCPDQLTDEIFVSYL